MTKGFIDSRFNIKPIGITKSVFKTQLPTTQKDRKREGSPQYFMQLFQVR